MLTVHHVACFALLRLVGEDEMDPETLCRLIEEYVLPLVAKGPHEMERIRQKIKGRLSDN